MVDLPKIANVVVVGGGVIGLSVARSLALRGLCDVLVIERGSLGAESSFAAAGMLAPQAEADRADKFFELCRQSRDLYPAFAASLRDETGIDVELETTGTLYLAFTEEDVNELEERYEWQSRAGLAIEKLSAEAARQLEPAISENVRTALRFPLDMQVENRRLVRALAVANETLGVGIVTETAVESIKLDRGCVAGVKTSGGLVTTDTVVMAGGAWTSLITVSEQTTADKNQSDCNTPDKAFRSVRIEPVRGQMLSFTTAPQIARHVIYSPRGYIVPRSDNRLLAGSTTEHVGFAKQVTDEGVRSITAAAVEISPQIASLPLTESWAGLRPRAPDNLPVLGPCAEIAGVFYATGHYRNGILLAPITGELIAQAIVDKVVAPALNEFSPDRFSVVNVT